MFRTRKIKEVKDGPTIGVPTWSENGDFLMVISPDKEFAILRVWKTGIWNDFLEFAFPMTFDYHYNLGCAISDDGLKAIVVNNKTLHFISLEQCKTERISEFICDISNVKFLNDKKAWLEIKDDYGFSNPCYYCLSTGIFEPYQLDYRSDYGRGIALHPSQKFIAALASDYSISFDVYQTEPISNRLPKVNFHDEAFFKDGYEAFSVCFNSVGDKLAFITDLGTEGNASSLVICDFLVPNKIIYEQCLYRNAIIFYTQFFCRDHFIILSDFNGFIIMDLKQKVGEQFISEIEDANISGHPFLPYFCLVHSDEISIQEIEDVVAEQNAFNVHELAAASAHEFLQKFENDIFLPERKPHLDYLNLPYIPVASASCGFHRVHFNIITGKITERIYQFENSPLTDAWIMNARAELLSKFKMDYGPARYFHIQDSDKNEITIYLGSVDNRPTFKLFDNSYYYAITIKLVRHLIQLDHNGSIKTSLTRYSKNTIEALTNWHNSNLQEIMTTLEEVRKFFNDKFPDLPSHQTVQNRTNTHLKSFQKDKLERNSSKKEYKLPFFRKLKNIFWGRDKNSFPSS